jgi:hypothetical protein
VQEVEEFGFKEYKLIIANSVAVPFVTSLVPKRIHVEVPVPPEKAKEVKPNIKAIAICKLAAPFTTSGELRKEPAHDDPISVNIDHKYLKVNILAIRICNRATGTVYAKIQPTDGARQDRMRHL